MINKLNTMRPRGLTDDFSFKLFLCSFQYSVDSLCCCIFLSILLLWQVIFHCPTIMLENMSLWIEILASVMIANEILGKLIKIGIHLSVLYGLRKALWLKWVFTLKMDENNQWSLSILFTKSTTIASLGLLITLDYIGNHPWSLCNHWREDELLSVSKNLQDNVSIFVCLMKVEAECCDRIMTQNIGAQGGIYKRKTGGEIHMCWKWAGILTSVSCSMLR